MNGKEKLFEWTVTNDYPNLDFVEARPVANLIKPLQS